MTRQELYHAAQEELKRRRQRAESEALGRKKQLYAEIPELGLLEQKQAEAGAAAARLAAEGRPEDAQKYRAELANIPQRRALLLQQHGLSPQVLQPEYHCTQCRDSGRKEDGSACTCLQEEIRRLRRGEVNEAGPLRLCRFENFTLDVYPERLPDVPVSPRKQMEGIYEGCRTYARDFSLNSGSLLMFGDAGLGKTHLALSIASEVLEKGFDVIYVSAQSTFTHIAEHRFDNGSDLMNSMLEADLLVLDDLGTEFIDAYVLSRMYELVNGRLRKPTIYTSNICKREMLEQRYTEKISSRLLGECSLMRFFGKDVRLHSKS